MANPVTGHCLCGDVSYQATGPIAPVLHCHCEPCRRATGNFVAASRAQTDNVTITGKEHLRWHELEFSRYGFCGNCGSHMFWISSEQPESTSLQLGCINNAEHLELKAVWFADEAQPHNHLPAVTHHLGNGDEYN